LEQQISWQWLCTNNFFDMHNSCTQQNWPCKRSIKNELCGGSLNNSFDFDTKVTFKVQISCNKEPIVKLGSFGHNSFKYWTYLSSLCPWAIIHVRIISKFLKPKKIIVAGLEPWENNFHIIHFVMDNA
jgi:glutathionyl-hydroquinone reductase